VPRAARVHPGEIGAFGEYLDAGAEHVIVMTYPPYDLDPVRRILT
jgi:hypothetical protein